MWRCSRSGRVEAPELEHFGVNLCNPPLDVRRVELLEALVGVGGEGLQRAVGRDESSRLGSGFRVQDLVFRVGLELRVCLVREGEELRPFRAGGRQGSGFRDRFQDLVFRVGLKF